MPRLEKLKEIAGSILYLLEKEKINSIENLKERLGKSFGVKWTNHRIKIEPRTFELGTEYTIKYIIPNREIPIEIRINPNCNYSNLIINNDWVHMLLFGGSIPRIKEELENLYQ
jgi:hypothetical protein